MPMTKIARVLVVSAIITAAACSSGVEQKPPAAESSDAAIKNALSTYVVEFLKRNPTTNTYLGGAGLDPSLADVNGTLRDYSAPALTDEDRWLTDTQMRLQ